MSNTVGAHISNGCCWPGAAAAAAAVADVEKKNRRCLNDEIICAITAVDSRRHFNVNLRPAGLGSRGKQDGEQQPCRSLAELTLCDHYGFPCQF